MGNLDYLNQYGVKRVTDFKSPEALLIDVRARTKSGTTRFGLSAPKRNGMLYCNFDRDLTNVRNLRQVIAGSANVRELDCTKWTRTSGDESRVKAFNVMKTLRNAVTAALKNGISSVIVDKGTDMHDCIAYAEFGAPDKSRKIGTKVYKDQAPLNRFWKSFFQEFKAYPKTNLVIIHQWGEEYFDDKPTGRSRSKGWNGVSYECTASVELEKDPEEDGQDKFVARVVDCTFKTEIEGEELRGKKVNFKRVAGLICPDRDSEHWA